MNPQIQVKATALVLLAGGMLCMPAFSAGAAEGEIDYGAGKVNSLPATKGAKAGGQEQFNYLALENHMGPSGVPVGGVGVGCFDYAPDGRFTRICLNNWHAADHAPVIREAPGTFLALWRKGGAQLLQRGEKGFAGMPAAKHTVYRGLFPVGECRVDDSTTVRVWSAVAPQNIKDSSLPLAWVEVEMTNVENDSQPMAIAFVWQDVIARNILDIRDLELLRQFGPTAWDRGNLEREAAKQNKPCWVPLPRVPTSASVFRVGEFSGVRQHSEPFRPVLKTYQNYNNEVALMAEQGENAEITTLPAFPVDAPETAWESFRQEGRFGKVSDDTPLYNPAIQKEMASAVAVRVTLKPHETRTVRFFVAWFQPELTIDPAKDDPITYFGKADYGRFYQNYFRTLPDLIDYAGRERERLRQETLSWHEPILSSTYPDWLKFKLINSAYTLYANTILNKAGDFTVMEGGMGGLAGTMDQRLSAHPFYQKFFTPIDRSELELFGHSAGVNGQILHFCGHYYLGLATRDGLTPVPDNCMVDNTGSWLVQLAKDWQQTGDTRWLNQFRGQVDRSLAYLRGRVASTNFQIISGSTTYDDFWHPQLYAYNASTYPCFLRAGAVLCRALGETARAEECASEAEIAAQDAMRALWNGRFFAYGANLDGSSLRNDIMFGGQLAGQFLSRCFTWGDIFPRSVTRASIVAQLKSNVGNSPDYYAPKVWLLKEGKAMNDPSRPADPNSDSTCWPFYLESYTAMTAIQQGYLDDGLEIMRHIQLVHLRNGWTWSQNLWRPDELTYMTAPVTWFITDVLAGTGLDVPGQTLFLAPALRSGEERVALPVFFPRFWGTVTADRKTHRLVLTVGRVFDGPEIVLKQVVAQPLGLATSAERRVQIPPFRVQPGAALDLSAHWDALVGGDYQPAVLPRLAQTPFLEANPSLVLPPVIEPAEPKFVDSLRVGLTGQTAGAEIFFTTDGQDPRLKGRLYTSPFEIKSTCTIQAAARLAGTWSPVRRRTYIAETYRVPDAPAEGQPGRWRWRYYEGAWHQLPDFSKLTAVASGEAASVNLNMRRRPSNYGVVFEGVLDAPRRGAYVFHLASDDGSRLTVGGKDVLNHDGIHGNTERTLMLPLEPGRYSLKLEYFQGDGGAELLFRSVAPGSEN